MSRQHRKSTSGYTQFPNYLLDCVRQKLTPAQWAIVTSIMRETLGWSRRWCQYPHKELAADSHLSVSTLRRQLRILEQQGYIISHNGHPNKAHYLTLGPSTYSQVIHKNSSQVKMTGGPSQNEHPLVKGLKDTFLKEKPQSPEDSKPLSPQIQATITELARTKSLYFQEAQRNEKETPK